ncbi:MAG TPA: DPP IV N-terminal domain-containing protein, partial [Pyrinomonadaceae bacterium]|nr:DPP IV N-terminal domain-containing protein [Pyrinomonadaceae bacterium]
MRTKLFLILLVLTFVPLNVQAQNKLLTIDDIFDPQKRINFNGNPSQVRWLKDGEHYLVVSKDRNAFPRLLRVDAVTGKSEPFYDAAKMEAAFAALPGMTKEDAHDLANQSFYQLNPSESGVLINFDNDLFYYEFGNDRAIRLTSTHEEEFGEGFSPDGRMVSFVRGNNLYVEDLNMQRRERALTKDGGAEILNGRLDWVYQEEVYGRGNFGAYWWSPDSTKIIFLQLDERQVP